VSETLHTLLSDARVWRAGRPSQAAIASLPTGYPALDRELAAAGWPAAALTEILLDRAGCGELRLVMPALAALSQQRDDLAHRWLMWIAPPHVPYAPALCAAGVNLDRVMVVHANDHLDVLWAAEQSLRSGNCAAVLAWVRHASDRKLRRLQLAAAEGGSWGILFRPGSAAAQPSPAALRVLLRQSHDTRTLHILKNRGGRPATIDADFLTT
jgi:cell division inhibitor SulA/protein ImuA